MSLTKRYQRFEPVTVRAATRVVRMGRMGRINRGEVVHYLRLLAAMDSHAGPRSGPALRRLAKRRASLHSEAIPGAPAPALVRRTPVGTMLRIAA